MLACAALLAVLPLLARGVSCGHDLTFHLLNWMEVAAQWHAGSLRPWWSFASAWNAGEPRFVFYPPLSWIAGAALGSLTGWVWAPIAYTWLVLFLCGIAMRHLLRRYAAEPLAVLGGCVYLANPYMLFTAFERTAYAELLAAAWIPLLLLEALRERINTARLAVAIGLLWLTNTPAAVLCSYGLLVVLLTRCVVESRRHGLRCAGAIALRIAAGFALGLGLAAAYLLPALVQHSSVQVSMAMIPGMQVTGNFLFERSGDAAHDLVLRQASWLAVGLLAVAAAFLLLAVRSRNARGSFRSMKDVQASHVSQDRYTGPAAMISRSDLLWVLAILTACILFLLLPVSAWLWRTGPELRFLQFPWRFLALQAAVTIAALVVALRWRPKPLTAAIAGLCLASALAWGAHALFAQACDPEDKPAALRAQFLAGVGFEPTDEYTPADADNDALKPMLPPAWLAAETEDAPAEDGGVVSVTGANPKTLHFVVRPRGGKHLLVVRLRQFRNWQVRVDGRLRQTSAERNDGLTVIDLPTNGEHEVSLQYAWSFDQWLGFALSVACLLAVALLVAHGRRLDRQPKLARPAIP